jgi:hypothetical protein
MTKMENFQSIFSRLFSNFENRKIGKLHNVKTTKAHTIKLLAKQTFT